MRNREGSSGPRVSGNLGAETDFLTLLSDANIPIPQHHKTQASCSRGTNRECVWGGEQVSAPVFGNQNSRTGGGSQSDRVFTVSCSLLGFEA